jgi:hypothetical protein
MADIKLSTVIGGGGLPQLAPDLTFPANNISDTNILRSVTVAVTAGVKSTTLNLSGKFSIGSLAYTGLVAESMTHKLTVDGVVIWDAAKVVAGSNHSFINASDQTAYECKSSFLLEITTTTDTSVDLEYLARPIL